MHSPLRVLQISDVHLGASMGGGRLGLSDEVRRRRTQERRDVFARAMALVIERDLDGVLLPGDLFDDEAVDTDTLHFVLHQLASLRPRPVFLAPGNHDPYGGTSPYNPGSRGAAWGVEWPDNVHLFAHEDLRTVIWPGRPEVTVTGSGVAANVPSATRRLAEPLPAPGGELSILLFHGSRDDGEWLQAHKSTHPFSREEILRQPFHWVALGHYHTAQPIHDDEGKVRAAYAGCPFAGGLDEQGEKGCLVLTLHPDGHGAEHVLLDERQVHRVECDLTGSSFHEDAMNRVIEALDRAGARRQDLVLVELVGRRSPGLDLRPLEALAEGRFHLRLDGSRLVPDVELEQYPALEDASTTEERFVAHLRDQLEGDQPERARRALLYGLDALTHGRVEPRYES